MFISKIKILIRHTLLGRACSRPWNKLFCILLDYSSSSVTSQFQFVRNLISLKADSRCHFFSLSISDQCLMTSFVIALLELVNQHPFCLTQAQAGEFQNRAWFWRETWRVLRDISNFTKRHPSRSEVSVLISQSVHTGKSQTHLNMSFSSRLQHDFKHWRRKHFIVAVNLRIPQLSFE